LVVLKLLIIDIDPEKMAPVLNCIVENEGQQDYLYRDFSRIFGTLYFKWIQRQFLSGPHVLAIL